MPTFTPTQQRHALAKQRLNLEAAFAALRKAATTNIYPTRERTVAFEDVERCLQSVVYLSLYDLQPYPRWDVTEFRWSEFEQRFEWEMHGIVQLYSEADIEDPKLMKVSIDLFLHPQKSLDDELKRIRVEFGFFTHQLTQMTAASKQHAKQKLKEHAS